MKLMAYGEVLFDVFQNEKKLGGAPMNFCAHASKLGDTAYLYSAVGNDESGTEVLKAAEKLNIKHDFIIKNSRPTGVCEVTLKNGNPSYELVRDCAYDRIEADDNTIKKINNENFDLLYFGSLICRSEASRDGLDTIIARARFKRIFCDINIRMPYFSKETAEYCMKNSDILKLSDEECSALFEYGLTSSDKNFEKLCRELCSKYDIEVIIVTMGGEGAFAYEKTADKAVFAPSEKVRVVSAVGAGDSFSACFLHNYMNGLGTEEALRRANLLGAYVVGHTGAIPEYTAELISKIK